MQVRIPSGRTHPLMEADPHRVLTSGIGRLISAALYERLATHPQSETKPDARQTRALCRILMHHPVIVGTGPNV